MNKMARVIVLLFLSLLPCILMAYSEPNNTSGDVINNNNLPKTELKMLLNSRQGIYRSINPIMIEITFENRSSQLQKLCTYKFEESLLKLDIRDPKGKKLDFSPSLVKSEMIKDSDWVEIKPGSKYKKILSLSRKVIDLTGYRLVPGNYKIKAMYDGCSKFDARIPAVKMDSNVLYLMITD